MNKIELLSPAGSLESFKASISAGADAVYMGGKNFSARAYASNFSNEQIRENIKYAHQIGCFIFPELIFQCFVYIPHFCYIMVFFGLNFCVIRAHDTDDMCIATFFF